MFQSYCFRQRTYMNMAYSVRLRLTGIWFYSLLWTYKKYLHIYIYIHTHTDRHTHTHTHTYNIYIYKRMYVSFYIYLIVWKLICDLMLSCKWQSWGRQRNILKKSKKSKYTVKRTLELSTTLYVYECVFVCVCACACVCVCVRVRNIFVLCCDCRVSDV